MAMTLSQQGAFPVLELLSVDVGGKEFNKLKFFLLPISSVEETKGMKVTFLSTLGYFC